MLKISKPTGVHLILILGVLGLMAVNATIIYGTRAKVSAEQKSAEDAAKPAELELTLITAPDCQECMNLEQLLAPLRSNPQVKIAKEEQVEYTSDPGVELIKKYGLIRVPTVLLRGEVAKVFDEASFVQNLGKRADDGTLVVTNVSAPYVEVASGAVRGKFYATYLTDKSCQECYDVTGHRSALASLVMVPTEEKFIDRAEAEGRRLIVEYGITTVPTILLSGDLSVYPQLGQVWPAVGTTEEDGTYVFRDGQTLMGAYYDLKTRKLVEPKLPEQSAPSSAAQQNQPSQ